MKSFATLLTSLVLTAAMLTGCGCTNRNVDKTTPTTTPTQEPTVPSMTRETDETINHGNGPLVEDGTAGTDNTTEPTAQNRAREGMPIR